MESSVCRIKQHERWGKSLGIPVRPISEEEVSRKTVNQMCLKGKLKRNVGQKELKKISGENSNKVS